MKREVKEIKRIRFWSALKIGALFGLLGAIVNLLQVLVLKFVPSIAAQMGVDASSISASYFVQAFIFSFGASVIALAVLVLIYNGFARLVGGIKLELE
jgi:cytochrome c biogenesis factor